jgi:hypothetical protein
MIRIEEHYRQGRLFSRRELLQIGGVSGLGLSLTSLAQGHTAPADQRLARTFGKAKHLLIVYLSGGPSQFETFDPKPDAPAEVRGIFKPIDTRVPGVRICELLPRTAAIMDRLAVIRSFSTSDPNHESAGYWIHTGYKYAGPNMRATHPSDWPCLGSVVKVLKPATRVPFTTVMLPEPIIANPNVFLPGQNAGFMGRRWDPELFRCDPAAADFRVEGLDLPDDLPSLRLSSRQDLLHQLDDPARRRRLESAAQDQDRTRHEAMQVLLSGAVRTAFDLKREPEKVRQRYGRGKWAQSILLARRLLEAGVRMVFVNWPRESGDLSSSNPLWDTHAANNARMKDVLCPQFDQGFPALIEDLEQRGLLAETLVVAYGEMGRTPTFNPSGGRDHWGNVFSIVLAGAGIAAGQVYGASDAKGAEPAWGRVQPQELTATIFHLLGIGHEAHFLDRFGRPYPVTQGQPLAPVLD